MVLVIDIGNSNIVIAIYKDDAWINSFRYETKDNQPQMFYERGLAEILFEWGIKYDEISKVAISSVVPNMNDKIYQACRNITGKEPMLLNVELYKKINFHIPLPNEIGSDLVANAYGCIKTYGKPSIIVDFGTALTFLVVHPQKGIEGVSIAPGIKTAFNSLYSNTALLPEAQFTKPTSAIGQNTSHAIQAGIIIGYEGLVEHLLNKIKEELSEEYQVVATGGMSEIMSNITDKFDVINKNLTLDGVRLLALDIV